METVFMGQELVFFGVPYMVRIMVFWAIWGGPPFFGNSHFKTCVAQHARSDWSPGCDERCQEIQPQSSLLGLRVKQL